MSMSPEQKRWHESYENSPKTKELVDECFSVVVEKIEAAGLPWAKGDNAEALVADIHKYIVRSILNPRG